LAHIIRACVHSVMRAICSWMAPGGIQRAKGEGVLRALLSVRDHVGPDGQLAGRADGPRPADDEGEGVYGRRAEWPDGSNLGPQCGRRLWSKGRFRNRQRDRPARRLSPDMRPGSSLWFWRGMKGAGLSASIVRGHGRQTRGDGHQPASGTRRAGRRA
jgi:hypothetical protein